MNAPYLNAIEARFLEHSGSGLMLSAKDLSLVEAWERAGIPVEIVLEGIDRAFENPPSRVRSLAYVRPAVDQMARLWRENQIGRPSDHPQETSQTLAQSWDRLIHAIEQAQRKCTTPDLAQLFQLALNGVQTLRDQPYDPQEGLETLNRDLYLWSLHHIDAGVIQTLRQKVKATLASCPTQDPSVSHALLWKQIRRYASLPELILTVGDGW